MTVLVTAASILILLLVVSLHEAGHGVALRQLGVPISEVGLGVPARPRVVLPPTGRRPFAVSLSPWLVLAYVNADPDYEWRLKMLTYRDTAWYFGAGVVVNLALGGVLLAVYDAATGALGHALVFAAGAGVVAVWRKRFCAYIVPVLGPAVLVVLGYGLATHLLELSGPVGIAASGGAAHGVLDWVAFTGSVNLGLGAMNLMPLMPLDGGRIWHGLLQRRGAPQQALDVVSGVGFLAVITLVVYAVTSDAAHLFP